NDFAGVDVHVDPVHHRPTSINLYQLVSSKDILGFCRNRRSDFQTRDRRSLADHGFGEGGEVGDGFVSFFVSSFGCCRISVRLGPCVVSWLFWLIIMTVSGLVATCMFGPSCTRGVPINSTSPVAAVYVALSARPIARVGGPPFGSGRSRSSPTFPSAMAFSRLWFCPFVMNTVNLSDCRLKRGSTTFTRPLKMPMFLVESKKASSE